MQEIWKDIKGYEGLYQVSNLGRVKSLKRLNYDINKKQNVYIKKEMLLKQTIDVRGYKVVKLQNAIEHNLCKARKVELTDINGNKYQFNHLHLMFKFLNIKPNGNYINFINKNKLYKGFYINDIKESD